MVRKVMYGKPPYFWIGDAWNERSGFRELLEVLKRLTNFGRKSLGYLSTTIAVPVGRFAQLTTSSFA